MQGKVSMGAMTWNEVKWAEANAKLGLKRDEICPGLTLDQHAESLAMFDMRNAKTDNNRAWKLSVVVLADILKKKLLGGITEEEIESF